MKLGATLTAPLGTLTAKDLCALLDAQSAVELGEYSKRSEPTDFRVETSEINLFRAGSESLIPSRATVWLPDSLTFTADDTGHTSTASSWVCVDAAATATADADAGRADGIVACDGGSC